MAKLVFTSFAGGDKSFRLSALRIKNEAINSKFFDRIYVFDDLTASGKLKNFLIKHFWILPERGFGFWAWKPYLLLEVFDQCNEGDIILYADAGCQISKFGSEKLYSNVSTCQKYGALFFDMPVYIEKDWTKKRLFEHMQVLDKPSILDTPQIQATYFYIKVNEFNKKIILEWANNAVEDNFCYINDQDSMGVSGANYHEHRHDQSILSILVKKYGLFVKVYECHFRSIEYFVNSKALLFPVHSLRNRGSRLQHYCAFKFSSKMLISSDNRLVKTINYIFYLLKYFYLVIFFIIKKFSKTVLRLYKH